MIHKHKKLHVLILFSFQTCVCLFLFASMFSSHLSDVTLSRFVLSSSVLFYIKILFDIVSNLFLKFLFVCSYPDFFKDAGLLKAAYTQL